jgi:hypothetical protein
MRKRLFSTAVLAGMLLLGRVRATEAQVHVGVGVGVGVGVHGGFYYASPAWYGYPWWPYWYPYPYYGYPNPYPYYDTDGSVRLQVTPKEAEVFVDGYYAGIVDDFDGVFQKLHMPQGDHVVTLYLDGYRTVHQSIRLTANTYKLKYAMEKLGPGEVAEPRPASPANPPPGVQSRRPYQVAPPQVVPPGPASENPPPPREEAPPRVAVSVSGALAIRVQPDQAIILIDGERWQGPEGQERLVVAVTGGSHHVQVQKEGYDTFSTDVTVRAGETATLNVSLRSH